MADRWFRWLRDYAFLIVVLQWSCCMSVVTGVVYWSLANQKKINCNDELTRLLCVCMYVVNVAMWGVFMFKRVSIRFWCIYFQAFVAICVGMSVAKRLYCWHREILIRIWADCELIKTMTTNIYSRFFSKANEKSYL